MAIPIAATLTVTSKAFTTGIKTAGKALGVFVGFAKAATFALVGLSAAFSALVLRQAAIIDRIGKVSSVTGVAAETLQKFSFAAEIAGVSTDQAQVALRRFSRRLGEAQKNTGELAPTLKRLGINLKDANGEFKSAEDVLFELADAIKDTDGASAELAIAFKAFDSEGAELVNVLKQGGDAMRALFNEAESLGAVLSGDAIRGVERFNDEFNKLQTLVSGISNQFVAALSPALTEVTKDLVEFLKQVAEANGGFENLGDFLKDTFIDILITTVSIFGSLINSVIALGRSIPGADLFPVDPAVAEEYEKINEALDLIAISAEGASRSFGRVAGGHDQFLGLVAGADTAQKLIDALKTIGVETTLLQELYDDITFADRISQGFMPTDDVNFFNEALLNAVMLAHELGDQTGVIAANQGINVKAITDYLESLKQVTPEQEDITKQTEKTKTFFERIAELIAGMPAKMKEVVDASIDFADVLEKVAVRLGTPMERLQKTLEDGLVKGVELFEDTLTNAILQGKADFTDLGNHIRQVLAKALVQKFITGPILAAFGLPGRAGGGPVKAGQPYMVGESGKELFIPNQSGTIIPNHQLGGASGAGATQVTYNISAIDTQSFNQALSRDPEFLFSVTQKGRRSLPSRS